MFLDIDNRLMKVVVINNEHVKICLEGKKA